MNEQESDSVIIELCEDKPMVMVCGTRDDFHFPTGNLTLLMNCDQLYMSDSPNHNKIDSILEQVDCGRGVVFMIITDHYWSMGLDGDKVMTNYVTTSGFLNKYEEYASCDFGTIYLAE